MRVFISCASEDIDDAMAVKTWLIGAKPSLDGEIFLHHVDLFPGKPWKLALQQANKVCEAVICLLSRSWEHKSECINEDRYSETLHKSILCARLEPEASSRTDGS